MFLLGILFLFDRALIIMGNVNLNFNIKDIIHNRSDFTSRFQEHYKFLHKKRFKLCVKLLGKIKGSVVFFVGFFTILILRFTIIGFILQLWGLFLLFKSFLPFIYDSATKLPIIGRYLSKIYNYDTRKSINQTRS